MMRMSRSQPEAFPLCFHAFREVLPTGKNITFGKAGGVYPLLGDSKRLLFRILVFPCASGLQCLCKISDAP